MDKRFAWIAPVLVSALLLGGCATPQTSGGGGGPHPSAAGSAAFRQAADLARSGAQLTGQARAENVRKIQQLLQGLDNPTLSKETGALPVGDPLYPYAGKLMADRGLALPRPFDRATAWNFEAAQRPPADRDGYRPPVKLAVLLPLSGPLAVAAAPVRDGLLAGYYGESRRRPEIQFIDTTGTPAGALAAYGKAQQAGADFVVGPLGRDEVGAVFGQPSLPVPLLALNRGSSEPPATAVGFSLAPEDDGIGAADYLFQREHKQVLVIRGQDDNATRAATAFAEHFTELGGNVTQTIAVADAPPDMLAALTAAASQGVDAVFLSIKGSTARVLAPQLAMSGLAGKARVGSSQLTQGTGKAEEDRVLDGIIYPTEAWTARGVEGLPAASSVASTLPTARGGAARLFAFGFDAWQLTAYLEKLSLGANATLRGATGVLSLDGFGNVQRAPAWATFSGGRPTPIAEGG